MIAVQRHALFLPEVAGEKGWTGEETVRPLCRKAEFPLDVWEREGTFELPATDAFGDEAGAIQSCALSANRSPALSPRDVPKIRMPLVLRHQRSQGLGWAIRQLGVH